ncbi:MAG: hypothetical protein AB7T49_03585 [Oligoflexales bacterium]
MKAVRLICTKKTVMLVVVFLASQNLVAKTLVQKNDRIEIDWSNQRVRYFGQASSENFREAELAAWQEGATYLNTALPKREEKDLLSDVPPKRIAQSSYSYDTTYFGDGTVKVYLESKMASLFHQDIAQLRPMTEADSKAKNSALIVRVGTKATPSALFKIVSGTGQTLYSVENVTKDGFQKNLMGRWFEATGGKSYTDFAGENPVQVDATVSEPGVFVVSESMWNEAMTENPGLLAQAKVAILAE